MEIQDKRWTLILAGQVIAIRCSLFVQQQMKVGTRNQECSLFDLSLALKD